MFALVGLMSSSFPRGRRESGEVRSRGVVSATPSTTQRFSMSRWCPDDGGNLIYDFITAILKRRSSLPAALCRSFVRLNFRTRIAKLKLPMLTFDEPVGGFWHVFKIACALILNSYS